MTTAYTKLITAFRSKDWTTATEAFRDIMEQKVAIRLAEEKKATNRKALCEETAIVCDKCGDAWPWPNDADYIEDTKSKCPKCGNRDSSEMSIANKKSWRAYSDNFGPKVNRAKVEKILNQ